MMKKMWAFLFCLSLLNVGCTNNNASNRKDNQDSQTKIPETVRISNTHYETELRDRIEQISRVAQGRVGVSATVLETGETVSLNGSQRFPMQSVYKLPIAMAVLAQVDQGKLTLNQKVRVEQTDFGAKP